MNEEKLDENIYLKDGSHKLPKEHTNIMIKVGDKHVVYNFNKEVHTDISHLSHEAIHLPAIRHYTGHLLASAEKELEVIKIKISKYMAIKRSEIRNKHPKLTDKDKDDLLNQDEIIYKLKLEQLEQQEVVNRLWSVVSGIKYKRDMLQTVSANLRAMKTENHQLSDVALNALEEISKGNKDKALELVKEQFDQKIG
jgi:hypothetical protein